MIATSGSALPGIRRIAVVGSASGTGKTTLARALAARVDGAFLELDSFRHGPNWVEAGADELQARLGPILAGERWVIDAVAEKLLGRLVLDAVELIVWLDLPPWVWLPRLVARSGRRLLFREQLWNGNRETLSGVLFERDSVFRHAIRTYFRRRRARAADINAWVWRDGKRVVRLGSVAEVEDFLAAFQP
jgi:adenylate kinase family enzyme